MPPAIVLAAALSIACLASAVRSEEPTQPPATQRSLAVNVGSAVILSTRKHQEDRGTYFTFARNMRGGAEAGRRTGDIRFYADKLETRKHSGDRSTIVDLGARSWDELTELPPAASTDDHVVPAIAGHAYLVHIDDFYVDYWAVLRVVAMETEDRCEVEWLRLDDPARPEPAISVEAAGRLARLLKEQDEHVDPAILLAAPRVVLQVRAGAGGGNPNRIDMLGGTSIYVDEVSPQPLVFGRPVQVRDKAVAYFEGGRIPPGKCFVVELVSYDGTAKGDSNGHGELIINVGKDEVVKKRDAQQPIKGEWKGTIEVRPGEESKVFVEVANSSTADVTLEGRLIDDPRRTPATQPATTRP